MAGILDSTTYNSAAMQQLCRDLGPFVHSAAPIFFWGETGTGMGFFAKALHNASRTGKFLTIPCFSLDEDTIQQQFLGANDQSGWLEEAHNGTIFLKRVAEAPLTVQQTFLRLIDTQTGDGMIKFSRKGGTESLQVNVRFIYSTAKDLNVAMQDGLLRRDLIDEIKKLGKTIHLPPLRDRKEDIADIIESLIKELNEQHHQVSSIDKQALDLLTRYNWPGNVRELSRVLSSIFSQYSGITKILVQHLPEYIGKPGTIGDEYFFTLKDNERFKGKFVSRSLHIQRDNSKFQIKTENLAEIVRVDDTSFAPPKLKHFEIKLEDGSQLAGMILDKTIMVATSFDKSHQINVQDLYAVVIS
jgi:DNA-binding NtrC family response regulator